MQVARHNQKKGCETVAGTEFQNALYGMMVEIIIFYRKFTNSLTDVGLILTRENLALLTKLLMGNR